MERNRLASYVRRAANTLFAGVDFLWPAARMKSRPFLFHIEYNDYCNLRCVQCPRQNADIPRNSAQWTLEMLDRIEPWLSTAGYVGIAGLGEPFLSPTLLDFLDRIVRAGAAPSVITNGTLITREKAERLAEMGPMLINVSFDGATAETFERIRVGARFEQVVENLAGLREAKERRGAAYPFVQIYWCLLQDNLREMERLPELARRIGAQSVQIQPAYDYGAPGARERQMVSNDEAAEAVDRLRRAAADSNIGVVYAPLNELRWPAGGKSGNGKARFFCPNLWRTLHFDPRGNVRVCCMGEFELVGNIFEQPLERMWNAPQLVAVRRALLRGDPPEPCRNCYLLEPYRRRQAASLLKQPLESLRIK